MIPDQPAVPPMPHVWHNQCLRHYMYHEFYEKPDREAIEKKFDLAKLQKPKQSVREYIWALKIAHDAYKFARFGKLSDEQQQNMKEDDDYTLVSIIKNNSIKDFKSFMQSKLTTDPNCLKTLDQMEDQPRNEVQRRIERETKRIGCQSRLHVAVWKVFRRQSHL